MLLNEVKKTLEKSTRKLEKELEKKSEEKSKTARAPSGFQRLQKSQKNFVHFECSS